ncbi:MAG: AAA family ATPase, partial [Candidatus Nitrosomaritimum aestuariumsis]
MENLLWCEKYRPQTVDDCILPNELKNTFKKFVKDEKIPNLLLSGRPGVGKTTIAKAMLNECGFDSMIINGSMNGNIDTLRNDILNYASTVSLLGTRKYVILDEADYLNPNSTQPALRNFMEEFSENCGFILTCNFKNRIIEPLHSRCSIVDFNIPSKEKPKLAGEFFKRVKNILTTENIEWEDKVIAELIQKHFPDWRRILNELQRYSSTGKIDSGILVNFSDDNFSELVKHLKEKNFNKMRKWVGSNSDIEHTVIYRKLYDFASEKM